MQLRQEYKMKKSHVELMIGIFKECDDNNDQILTKSEWLEWTQIKLEEHLRKECLIHPHQSFIFILSLIQLITGIIG